MRGMTVRVVFRWVAWLLVAAVAAFTLSPIEMRPVTAAPAGVERFIAFAAIGGAFGLGYPRSRIGVFLLVIGIAGLLEAAQHLVPGRHGHLQDAITKAAGACLGVAAAQWVDRVQAARRAVGVRVRAARARPDARSS
jgi:VanZ family protein